MMSSGELLIPKDVLHKTYVDAYKELGLRKETLANLLGLGEYSVSTRNAISAKIKGSKDKMPTKADVAWITSLVALKELGVDLEKVSFNQDRKMVFEKS